MVPTGVVSDRVCINPVMIVLAERAAGGSSWCLSAKVLTSVPGLRDNPFYYSVVVSIVFSLQLWICFCNYTN